jgi:hypothetical protein
MRQLKRKRGLMTVLAKRRFVVLTALLVAGISAFLVFAPAQPAQAQTFNDGCPNKMAFGRLMCDGYFTGTRNTDPPNPSNAVFYNGLRKIGDRDWVNNVNDYVALMRAYLYDNDGNRNVDYGSNDPAVRAVQDSDARRNNIGAAHHIDVMLGKQGPEFGGSIDNGIAYAKANFNTWETTVRGYASRGQLYFQMAAVSLNMDGSKINHSTGQPPNNADNEFFTSEFYLTQTVQFTNPVGNVIFQIEMDCGNIFGVAGALVNPPTGDINQPTPATANDPPGYNNGDSNVYSSCSVVSGHAFNPDAPSTGVQVTVTYSIGGQSTATASTSGSHLWTVNTPANVRNSIQPVTVTAVGRVGATTYNLTNSPIQIGACLKVNPACDSMTVTPSSLDPSTPFTVTAGVHYGSSAEASAVLAQPGVRFYMTIKGPNVNDNVPSLPITNNGSGGLTASYSRGATNAVGEYKVGWGIASPVGSIPCGDAIVGNPDPPTFIVADKPYFEVKNGDLSAGAGMSVGGTDCAVSRNDNASIVGWNRGSAGGYGGAGTQYAALALNHLQGFATGQGSTLVPSGVSFANNAAGQVNIAGGLFGGKFGGTNCTADYFANATNVQTGPYIINGDLNIANGSHQVIYVNGDVYIKGNIRFSGSYGTTSAIPSFSIVARGNIYIAPNVQQLDGFYIAQPASSTDTKGNIYTCANNNVPAALDDNIRTMCGTQLVVNGSFIGRQVWLLRTYGSLTGAAAESFNYSPELWLSAPFGNNLSQTQSDYDSITSLPPVL